MPQITVSKITNLTGHNDSVYTIEHAQQLQFFSGAGDGMVALWDTLAPENGRLIAKLPNSVYALHLHNNELIVGHNYDGIHAIDWRNKKETWSLKFTDAAIFDIKSFNDYIIVATGDGTVVIVNSATKSIVHRITHSKERARSISVHPDKSKFAVGYSDNFVRIFDTEKFELINEWAAHNNSVFIVCYSPDGDKLFSSGRDAHLKIWDSRSCELIEDIVAHMYAINHIEFSPTSQYFATCSMDKSIKVWDAHEYKLLKVIDKSRHAGHGTSVNKLLWVNDYLCSASDDRSIALWDVQIG